MAHGGGRPASLSEPPELSTTAGTLISLRRLTGFARLIDRVVREGVVDKRALSLSLSLRLVVRVALTALTVLRRSDDLVVREGAAAGSSDCASSLSLTRLTDLVGERRGSSLSSSGVVSFPVPMSSTMEVGSLII